MQGRLHTTYVAQTTRDAGGWGRVMPPTTKAIRDGSVEELGLDIGRTFSEKRFYIKARLGKDVYHMQADVKSVGTLISVIECSHESFGRGCKIP